MVFFGGEGARRAPRKVKYLFNVDFCDYFSVVSK